MNQMLASMHDREFAAITGSATMAITLGLKELDLRQARVAIPSNVCHSIPQAVIYSGNEPVYIDIDEDDLGLSPMSLAETRDISAVIAVHAYGSCCKIEKIQEICVERKLPLIEDASVALGASIQGRPVGSFGEFSVLSFGSGKIVDLGHGGALLTNDVRLFEAVEKKATALACFSDRNEEVIKEISSYHTMMYNEQYLESDALDSDRFRRKIESNRASFLFSAHPEIPRRLPEALSDINRNIESRQEFAKEIQRLLEGNNCFHSIEHRDSDVYWRQNLVFQERKERNIVLKDLLSHGFNVSSWYPPVEMFMETCVADDAAPRSRKIGDRILNLWVNDEIDQKYLEKITTRILKLTQKRNG